MNQHSSNESRTALGQLIYLLFFKMLSLILLNIMFILTCIPLITIPQSIAALNKSMQHIISGEERPVYKVYFRVFKSDYLKTFILGFGFILLLSITAYGAYFFYLNSTVFIYLFFTFSLLVFFFILYAISIYALQMLVSVDLPLKAIIKNAIILTFTQIKPTLFASVASILILALSLFFFPYTTPLLILISFSLSAYLATFSCFSIIQRKIIK